MYCYGRFIKNVLIFILINMGTIVLSDLKIDTGTKQQQWHMPDSNDLQKKDKTELLLEREKLLKKQLNIINGHLYDTLKERLNLIQKDLKKVSKDLNIEYTPYKTDELLTDVLQKRSSIKDNFSEEYKKRMDKIDNQITMGGDNQNLMADRSDRSFLSWYNRIISVPKLLNHYNKSLNNNDKFQTKFLAKKDINSIQPITQEKLYDFSKRNTIKESLFDVYCKEMNAMAHTRKILNKRSHQSRDIDDRKLFLHSHPLEMNKWLTSKGGQHKNNFDEGIWQVATIPCTKSGPYHKRIINDIKTVQLMHPLHINKELMKTNREYYSNDLDENTWKTIPTILDMRKRRNCRNVDTFIHYNPLKVNKWLGTKNGEYYKSDFDQDIWKVKPIPPLPTLTLSTLPSQLSFNYNTDADRRRYTLPNKTPMELNKLLLTKGGEYYKNDLDQNLWKLPSIPPTPIPGPDSRIPYKISNMLTTSKHYPRYVKPTETKGRIFRNSPVSTTSLYPNVLSKAVEISLNPTNQAHIGGNLLENVAKKMNTSTLDLAEKIVTSGDINSLMNNAAFNKMSDTYSKTVITPKPISTNENQPTVLSIVPSVQPKPISTNDNQSTVLSIVPSVQLTPAPKSFNGTIENNNNNNINNNNNNINNVNNNNNNNNNINNNNSNNNNTNNNNNSNNNINNANSNPDYIVMPNESNINITTILDQVLAKLESIQHDKICEDGDENARPEGTPCDIVGLWSSQTLGLCLNIEINEQKYRDNTHADKYHSLKVEPHECTPPKIHTMLGLDWSFGGATQKQIGGPFYIYAYKQSERSLATFTGFCRTCFAADTLFGSWTLVTPNKDCSDILLALNNKADLLKRIELESKRKERFKNLLLQQQRQQLQQQQVKKNIFT